MLLKESIESLETSLMVKEDNSTVEVLPYTTKIIALIFQHLETFFTRMEDYLKKNLLGSSDPITSAQVGYLVPVKCGHRGKPNRSEEKMIEALLRQSDFLLFDEYRPSEKREVEPVHSSDSQDEDEQRPSFD